MTQYRHTHGRAAPALRQNANPEKVLNTEARLCRRLVADRHLNDHESASLSTWLNDAAAHNLTGFRTNSSPTLDATIRNLPAL